MSSSVKIGTQAQLLDPDRDRLAGSVRVRGLDPVCVLLDEREDACGTDPDDEVDPPDRVLRLMQGDDQADDPHRGERDRFGEVSRLERLVPDDPESEHPDERDDADDPDRPREPAPRSLGHGVHSTGRRPATAVPSPGAEVTTSSPPRAASRSAMPCRPVP